MTRTNNNNVKLRRNAAGRSASTSPTRPNRSAAADDRPTEGNSLPLAKLCLLVSILMALIVVCFVVYEGSSQQTIVLNVPPTDESEDDEDLDKTNEVLPELFIPFSMDVLQTGHVYFKVDMNATLAGREIGQPRLPLLITVSVKYGTLYISDSNEPLLAVGVSACNHGYDEIGKDKQQKFYFRQVTSDQHLAYTCCLLNERQVRIVFSLTWVNMTYDEGKQAGDFQCLVAFVDESTAYLIRTYSSDLVDLNAGQFSMFDYVSSHSYDVDLKASDVRGKRIAHKISEKPKKKAFARVEVNPNCHL